MTDQALRQHLLNVLDGREAHTPSGPVFRAFPPEARGARVEGLPYSPWRLLEHQRLTQWDLLEYCRNPDYVAPEFPRGYWPETEEPPSESAWDESVAAFEDDLRALRELIEDPDVDLFAIVPGGPQSGHTILRSLLVIVDHGSHHLGQMILLARLLGVWPT